MYCLFFRSSQYLDILPILAWRLAGHAKIKIVHQSSDFDSLAFKYCFAIRLAAEYFAFR